MARRAQIIIDANSGTRSGLTFSARMRAYEQFFNRIWSIDNLSDPVNALHRADFVKEGIKEIETAIDGRKWTDTDISSALNVAASAAGLSAVPPSPAQIPLGILSGSLALGNAAVPYFYDQDPLNPFGSAANLGSAQIIELIEAYREYEPEIYIALRDGFKKDFGVDLENIPDTHIAVQVDEVKVDIADTKNAMRQSVKTIGQIEILATDQEKVKIVLAEISDAQKEQAQRVRDAELLAAERENVYAYFGIGIAILNQRGDRQGAALLKSALMAVQISDRMEDDENRGLKMGAAVATMNYISVAMILFDGFQNNGGSPVQTMMGQLVVLFQDVFDRLESIREQMHTRFDRVDRQLEQIVEQLNFNFYSLDRQMGGLKAQIRTAIAQIERLNDNVVTGFRIGEWKENQIWIDRCLIQNLHKNYTACLSRSLQKAGFLNLYSLSYDQLSLNLFAPQPVISIDLRGLAYAGYFHDLVEIDGYRSSDFARNTEEYKWLATGTSLDETSNPRLNSKSTPHPLLWMDSTAEVLRYISNKPVGISVSEQLRLRLKETLARGVEIEKTLNKLAFQQVEENKVQLNIGILHRLFEQYRADLLVLADEVDRYVYISPNYQIPLASNMKLFLDQNSNWIPLKNFKTRFNSGAEDRLLTSCWASEPHFTNFGLHVNRDNPLPDDPMLRPNRKPAPGSIVDKAALTIPESQVRSMGIPDIAWVAEILGLGHVEFCVNNLSIGTGHAHRVYQDLSQIKGAGIIDISKVQVTFEVGIRTYFVVEGEANNRIAAQLFDNHKINAANPLIMTLGLKSLNDERFVSCPGAAGANEISQMIDGPMPAGSRKANPNDTLNPFGDVLKVDHLKAMHNLWLGMPTPLCQVATSNEAIRTKLDKQLDDGILAQLLSEGKEEVAIQKTGTSEMDEFWRVSVGYDTGSPFRSFASLLQWAISHEIDARATAIRGSSAYEAALASYNRLVIFWDLSLPSRTEDAEELIKVAQQITSPDILIAQRIGDARIWQVPAGELLDARLTKERVLLEELRFSTPASTRGEETIRRRLLQLGYFHW